MRGIFFQKSQCSITFQFICLGYSFLSRQKRHHCIRIGCIATEIQPKKIQNGGFEILWIYCVRVRSISQPLELGQPCYASGSLMLI